MGSGRQRLAEVVAPIVETAGLVLEGVEIATVGRRRLVRVVVDLPETETGSVDLDRVAEVSRAVAARLDEPGGAQDVVGPGPYSLEVSTPGVDRPLTERRHWMRARTRLVRFERRGESPVTGRLVEVTDAGPVVEVGGETVTPAWDDVTAGRIEVEFGRSGSARGGDAS